LNGAFGLLYVKEVGCLFISDYNNAAIRKLDFNTGPPKPILTTTTLKPLFTTTTRPDGSQLTITDTNSPFELVKQVDQYTITDLVEKPVTNTLLTDTKIKGFVYDYNNGKIYTLSNSQIYVQSIDTTSTKTLINPSNTYPNAVH